MSKKELKTQPPSIKLDHGSSPEDALAFYDRFKSMEITFDFFISWNHLEFTLS